jgi:hypothetical protein
VIRIHISANAYEVLAASCGDPLTPQRSAQGGFFIWLDRTTVNQLRAAREPGEGFSETILRLAELEGVNC